LAKGDEDEGSLPRGRAKDLTNPSGSLGSGSEWKGPKIERSADALRARHTPAIFPSGYQPCHNAAGQPRGQNTGVAY